MEPSFTLLHYRFILVPTRLLYVAQYMEIFNYLLGVEIDITSNMDVRKFCERKIYVDIDDKTHQNSAMEHMGHVGGMPVFDTAKDGPYLGCISMLLY